MFKRMALLIGLVATFGLCGCCGWVVYDHPRPVHVVVVRGCR